MKDEIYREVKRCLKGFMPAPAVSILSAVIGEVRRGSASAIMPLPSQPFEPAPPAACISALRPTKADSEPTAGRQPRGIAAGANT
ncbi:hypothetical protein [Dehalogenimonas sp. 4OHTPN]|uniref:Uncharacterized protein n=1 Tax=Dehalogenimonas sp. 4OHTPN TaxID=3166643 RepID=A0AAU8GCK8_9CHLR